jgi:ElaA protein
MELVVKHFRELSAAELFEIYKLRVSVFVVEQNCPYQEVDDADTEAFHLYLKDDDDICAYLRVLPKGITHDEVSLGRVISLRRRCGIGTQIVKAGIQTAKEQFGADKIVLNAQTYARKLYENLGFLQCGDEFLEDEIPHIPMVYHF